MLGVEVIHDLFHVGPGLCGFGFVVAGEEGQQAVLGGRDLVHFKINVGQRFQLLAVAGEGGQDVVPFPIHLGGDFLHGGRLIDIHGGHAQLPGAVDADALGDAGSRRGRHIDGRNPDFLQRDGQNGGGGRRTHVAKGHDGGGGLFLGQHFGVLHQLVGVLPPDRLGILHPVFLAAAQLLQALFDAVKDGVVVAEAQLRVVVEENLPLLQLLQGGPLGQLQHGTLLITPGVEQRV